MQFTGEGLIIGTRKHGETSIIAEIMIADKGRYFGIVRGGRSKRLRPVLQLGNNVEVTWRARLEDHLGVFNIELIKARAANMIFDKQSLYLGQLLCSHLRLLPERYAQNNLLEMTINLLDNYEDNRLLAIDLAKYELFLLEELGFGLDLYSCAISGETTGLSHISPKTGRAVTLENAKPYIERLLPLPPFFISDENASKTDIANGFNITKHFLAKHIWNVRQIDAPTTRQQIIDLLLNQL